MLRWSNLKKRIQENCPNAGERGKRVQHWLYEAIRVDSRFSNVSEQLSQGVDIEFEWQSIRFFFEVKYIQEEYVLLSQENIDGLLPRSTDGELCLLAMNSVDNKGWVIRPLDKFDLQLGPGQRYDFREMRAFMKNNDRLILLSSILDELFYFYVRDNILNYNRF